LWVDLPYTSIIPQIWDLSSKILHKRKQNKIAETGNYAEKPGATHVSARPIISHYWIFVNRQNAQKIPPP
jgi:hypothetical protein